MVIDFETERHGAAPSGGTIGSNKKKVGEKFVRFMKLAVEYILDGVRVIGLYMLEYRKYRRTHVFIFVLSCLAI